MYFCLRSNSLHGCIYYLSSNELRFLNERSANKKGRLEKIRVRWLEWLIVLKRPTNKRTEFKPTNQRKGEKKARFPGKKIERWSGNRTRNLSASNKEELHGELRGWNKDNHKSFIHQVPNATFYNFDNNCSYLKAIAHSSTFLFTQFQFYSIKESLGALISNIRSGPLNSEKENSKE